MSPGGRPPLANLEIARRIAALMLDGAPATEVVPQAGMSLPTFYATMGRGRDERREPYLSFYEIVEAARVQGRQVRAQMHAEREAARARAKVREDATRRTQLRRARRQREVESVDLDALEDAPVPGLRLAEKGMTEYVYFVQAVGGGPIKIGWTVHPPRRLCDLQNGNPAELRFTRLVRGGRVLADRFLRHPSRAPDPRERVVSGGARGGPARKGDR